MFAFGILLLTLCGSCVGYSLTYDTQSCKDHGKYMDDTTRHKLLQYHEGTRFTLALGESPSKDGFHPPAKNLFKMRWNCTLEEEARTLTKGCPKNVSGAPENGMNLFHDNVTDTKQGKYNFLSDAVDFWLYESDRLPMGPNATFNDTRMYPFANMAYQMIYEVGCHYEQCASGSSVEASVLCIYNTNVTLGVQLYEIGSWNQTIAGCAWNDEVCKFIELPEPEKIECEDLLCMLPYRVKSRYL